MRPALVLVVVVGVLFGAGVTLLLERSLTRVVLGVVLMSNGINLLILLAGQAGGAPLIGLTDPATVSDPLPQAMVLTAIVISFGMTALLLAVAYRSWQVRGDDEVQDDPEDRRLLDLIRRDEAPTPDVGPDTRAYDPEQVDLDAAPAAPPRKESHL
ncbi:Na(+)/H(+) antiporter subunit C [Plantactinospora sp. KBS50]|uniref:Na(+)/H(+) antiporter subunit C n=1 Tax=Plantactinospora sp. KBS50 TaxID=2024580 RepID=UPI000BAA980A|nr:Na(+)/H(+) antiporter subunit C [Plantactinospora sp. KBS50]ASW54108.1 Na(+)/H(+) antiporter subunit C [Plantactinospora sp. KBS50]